MWVAKSNDSNKFNPQREQHKRYETFINYLILTTMKTKFFFAVMLLACATFAVNAQGYKDGIDFYKIGKLDDARELLERNLNNPQTLFVMRKATFTYFVQSIFSCMSKRGVSQVMPQGYGLC